MFKSFVNELPSCCIVEVRISDNVMGYEDFGIDQLYIENGRVLFQIKVSSGLYAIPNMIGHTTDKLVEWSSYDSAGRHPETQHELQVFTF